MGKISDTLIPVQNRTGLNDMYLVAVYYPRSKYTIISELPKMSPFDLVSSVGGTLGLFVGLSFFTLVEMVEILLEVTSEKVNSFYKNKKNGKNVTPNDILTANNNVIETAL